MHRTLCFCLTLVGFGIAPTVSIAAEPESAPVTVEIQNLDLRMSLLVPKALESEEDAIGEERATMLVSFDCPGLQEVTVTLSSEAWGQPIQEAGDAMPQGRQTIAFSVPLLKEPITVRLKVASTQGQWESDATVVQPPRLWTIYLVQHTHTDIGYTRPQTEILPEHLRYIDYALDYCDLTDNYPREAQFHWTCETSWAVREYLKRRPAEQIARLKKRVAEGRIEVCGLMLNMSELASESSLAALLRPLDTIESQLGIAVRTAMQNDVNGAGWCLPDYMNSIGMRYLTMGINKTRSILPFDKPTTFWWESPSGRRVLAYRADHYMTGNFWKIHEGDAAAFQEGLEKYLLSLQDRAYPFDRVSVQFSGYFTDNSPPAVVECDIVKSWNEKFTWPRLQLATAQEFLSWVEQQHGKELPVHRQAWPDWWTDGFGSAARETAAARETESSMQVNHGLLAMASILGTPISTQAMQRAASIQDDLLFYHEHTYGAAESISDPLAENSQVQWGEKAAYVWSAVKESAMLREEAFGLLQDHLPRAKTPTLAVVNTLNWQRSGLVRVFIDHEILPPDHDFHILDGDRVLPAQALQRRAEGTYWAIWVPDVPPLGYKILGIESRPERRSDMPVAEVSLTLENRDFKIVLDDQRGAISSLIDKEAAAELVDSSADWELGQCLYETMPNDRNMKPDRFRRTSLRNVKVAPGANGPIWQSLLVTGELDGCSEKDGFRAEIRLYEPEKRIELHFAIRKLPITDPESVYVAFPFAADDWSMFYEAQGGCVVPGQDQIPGSSSDWQTLQSFVSVHNADHQIILGSEQAPLVQLGDFNLGKWMPVTKVERPHVYSWVMNNYWFTNFRAEQEGVFAWHYYLTTRPGTSRTDATRFGWNSRVPLATRVLPPASGPAGQAARTQSAIDINVPNILVLETRPTRDGTAIFVHLRELDGRPTTITEADVATCTSIQTVEEVNVLERYRRADLRQVELQPYEAKWIRVEF